MKHKTMYLLGALLAGVVPASAAQTPARPNILLIVSDDLNLATNPAHAGTLKSMETLLARRKDDVARGAIGRP